MRLLELAQGEISNGYYDPNNDKVNGRSLGDTRKPKLTLRKINRLKKMRALDALEAHKRQDLLAVMYAQPDEDAGGMGMRGMGF